MKARVEASILARALKTVLPAAVTRGASMPIYAGVRLDCDGSTLQLQCTSWDLTITTEIDVDGGEGVSVVPAGLLHKIVSGITGAVTLAGEGTSLSVDGGSVTAELVAFDERGWPQLPVVEGEVVELSDDEWDDIARLLPLVSLNADARPDLVGVHFVDHRIEATDSYRAGTVTLTSATTLPEILVPGPGLKAVLDARVEGLTLSADDTQVRFTSGPTTWTLRQIDKDYPNLPNLINALPGPVGSIECKAEDLTSALSRLSAVAPDNHAMVLTLADGVLELTSTAKGVGRLSVAVDASGELGESLAANPKYLGDMINAHGGDVVRIEVRGQLKPITASNGRMFQLLVPVRTGISS